MSKNWAVSKIIKLYLSGAKYIFHLKKWILHCNFSNGILVKLAIFIKQTWNHHIWYWKCLNNIYLLCVCMYLCMHVYVCEYGSEDNLELVVFFSQIFFNQRKILLKNLFWKNGPEQQYFLSLCYILLNWFTDLF